VGFAIELHLDEASAAVVRDLWRRLTAAPIGAAAHGAEARPHVTLAVADGLDLAAAERLVVDVARTMRPLPVTFASLGAFATDPAVLFLAPVVTAELLRAHERLQARFAAAADRPWPYYAPGAWVPHCTLAEQLPRANLGLAVAAAAAAIALPLAGTLERVGIVEFRPVQERALFALGTGPPSPRRGARAG
jgi:2'-5' RNA ligase